MHLDRLLILRSPRMLCIQAIMCLEKGVATRDDIDKTLKLGMNHPMGPLQLGEPSPLY